MPRITPSLIIFTFVLSACSQETYDPAHDYFSFANTDQFLTRHIDLGKSECHRTDAGRVLFPDMPDVETVMPTMARELLPPLVTGVFLVMVLAAVMSTVDSLLILASSAVVRDLMQKILNVGWQDAQLARFGMFVTVAIGVGAMAFALTEIKVIFWFVVFAMSGLSAAFGPTVICALFYKGITREGALAGMIGGFATDMIWVTFIRERTHDLVEIVPAVIISFALIFIVSRATRR